MMLSRNTARIGLGAATEIIIACGVVVLTRNAEVVTRTHVVAYFDNSNGIYTGDRVSILGVPVGRIEKIEPGPTRVKISFWYDGQYTVPAQADAVILAPSLVTARLIQL